MNKSDFYKEVEEALHKNAISTQEEDRYNTLGIAKNMILGAARQGLTKVTIKFTTAQAMRECVEDLWGLGFEKNYEDGRNLEVWLPKAK